MSRQAWLGWMILAAAAAAPTRGAEARLQLDAGLTWTGAPTGLRVEVRDPASNVVACEVPPVPGLKVDGPFRVMHERQDINGRRSHTLSIPYQLTPEAGTKGKISIGPARVRCEDGSVLTTGTAELSVYDRPPVGVHMSTALVPPGGPVGAAFRVIYTVHYFGETGGDDDDFFSAMRRGGGLGLTALELPVLSLSGARVEPVQTIQNSEAHTVTLQNQQRAILQRSFAEKDGKGYLAYVLAFDVTPFQAGPIELGGARVGMELKTGKQVVKRDGFFGSRRVDEVKQFTAESAAATFHVEPLPADGRPPGFNGAVGQYRIAVTASPTEVDEGAPITVEVRVTGKGLIDELKPPIWTEIESLTRDFSVSGDVDSGKVEQGVKVFRQLIRPQNAQVAAIPPIPFPYFDPALKRYQVARSEAIPIQVRAVKVVGADAAVASPRAAASPVARPHGAGTIVADQDGIGANFESMGAASGGVAPIALDPRDELLSPSFLAFMLGAPCVLGAAAALRRRRRRDPARRRRAAAWSQALQALGAAREPAAVAIACESYFRDRLGLPHGEVTPADARRALQQRGVPPARCEAAACVLEQAQASRFGAGGLAPGSLAEDAKRMLAEVEECLRG